MVTESRCSGPIMICLPRRRTPTTTIAVTCSSGTPDRSSRARGTFSRFRTGRTASGTGSTTSTSTRRTIQARIGSLPGAVTSTRGKTDSFTGLSTSVVRMFDE
uniref:(northern house mosquito) hypothetical protein n=1 Tax=Culex pipiens TaxID=7175 RepID=A0A8D8CHL5_CULPI